MLDEPPYTDPYVRWCERTGAKSSLLLDPFVFLRAERMAGGQEFWVLGWGMRLGMNDAAKSQAI